MRVLPNAIAQSRFQSLTALVKTSLGNVLTDRRLWTGTPARVVALLALLNVVIGWNQRALQAEHAANLLIAANADSAILAKGTPRFDRSAGGDLDRYWTAIPDARSNRLAVLVGMSSLFLARSFLEREWLGNARS
jgi:hypothetical protein